MTRAQLFPTIMIVLSVCAALVCAYDGDWRKTVYWLAAASLNTVVTY